MTATQKLQHLSAAPSAEDTSSPLSVRCAALLRACLASGALAVTKLDVIELTCTDLTGGKKKLPLAAITMRVLVLLISMLAVSRALGFLLPPGTNHLNLFVTTC
jgi:hypothetical protein